MLGNVWWSLQPSRDNSPRYLQWFPHSPRSEVSEDSFEKSIAYLRMITKIHHFSDIWWLFRLCVCVLAMEDSHQGYCY